MSEKKCSVCRKVLPLKEFYKHNTTLDRLFSSCKECVKRERRQQVWIKNPFAHEI